MKRNPPTPGFEFLSKGGFSSAYAKSNIVESISSANHYNGTLDISKWIISKVRPTLSENAKRFLPDIKFDRVDKSKYGEVEYVYKMPLYSKSPNFEPDDDFKRNIIIYHVLNSFYDTISHDGKLIASTRSLKFIADNLKMLSVEDYSGLSEALMALHDAVVVYASVYAEAYHAFIYDICSKNIAFDGCQLVLLDPFLLGVEEEQAEAIIQEGQFSLVQYSVKKDSLISRYLQGCLA